MSEGFGKGNGLPIGGTLREHLSALIVDLGIAFELAECLGKDGVRLTDHVRADLRCSCEEAGLPPECMRVLLDVYRDVARRMAREWPVAALWQAHLREVAAGAPSRSVRPGSGPLRWFKKLWHWGLRG